MSDETCLSVLALTGIGEVRPGDDLAGLIAKAGSAILRDDDILVVTSKIVSKAEGRLVDSPTDPAGRESARQAAIDAETVRVVATRGSTRIVTTRHGLVLAAAGVDASNVEKSQLVLLPVDPDASARALRAELGRRLGIRLAVVVSDTMGRTWRTGQTDVAIGAAGIEALRDHRGETDPYGNPMSVTAAAVIDELAAAGDLVKAKTTGIPVAVVRGLGPVAAADGPGAASLVRSGPDDMFALGTAEARAAGRLDMLAALLSGSGLAARAVPAETVAGAVGLVLTSVNHPRRWRFVHAASDDARERVAALRGLPWIRHAPGLLAVLHPAADQDTDIAAMLHAPFAAAGLVLSPIPLRAEDPARVTAALDIPAGWRLVGLHALGYPADPVHPGDRDPGNALIIR